jgi:hypothetical protein
MTHRTLLAAGLTLAFCISVPAHRVRAQAPAAPALFGGHKRIAHTGSINGFSSVIVRLPDTNVTVIVLANNDTANASAVARDVAAIYYGQPYTLPAERRVAKVDPSVFDRYVGRYELEPGVVITVTREGDSLMTSPKWRRAPLPS